MSERKHTPLHVFHLFLSSFLKLFLFLPNLLLSTNIKVEPRLILPAVCHLASGILFAANLLPQGIDFIRLVWRSRSKPV